MNTGLKIQTSTKVQIGISPTWFEEAESTYERRKFKEVTSHRNQDSYFYRGLNILAAVIMIGLTAPFLLIGVTLVWLSDGRPLFFSQKRVGFRGNQFKVWKFRTMVKDAEKSTGAVWAGENDSRLIQFGKFLRKWRIDELPQILNILKGDMNLIGPRPERPEFYEMLENSIPSFKERLKVKPGITGLAQISHGYTDTPEGAEVKHQYDMFYIENCDYPMDFKIIGKTFGVVFSGFGAR
jgi:lipopolysaccharide/colanic/teichoic acid biosynthesis glycosyltransferase